MSTDITVYDRRTTPPGRPGFVNGRPTRRRGEPTWEVARAFPRQGEWSEEEYLDFEESSGNQMVELVDGFLEFLPMPIPRHQRIATYVYRHLFKFVDESSFGEVLMAPCPIRLWERNMREPDVFLVKSHRVPNPDEPPEGADLVVEVPSPGEENRKRDYQTKRRVYARAKIPEYWIIDPEKDTITVFTLSGKAYKVHGRFKPGQQATSKLLPGFALDVAAVFAAGAGKR